MGSALSGFRPVQALEKPGAGTSASWPLDWPDGYLKGSTMRRSPESCRPNCCTRLLLLAVFLAYFCVLPAMAQKAQGTNAGTPKYDSQTETTVKGTVEELKLPAKANEIAHLMVKSGAETFDVYLCPKSFLDDVSLSFTKGEEIAVTGSKVKLDEADMVLAREVAKGNDTVMLRDPKGVPVWNWQKK